MNWNGNQAHIIQISGKGIYDSREYLQILLSSLNCMPATELKAKNMCINVEPLKFSEINKSILFNFFWSFEL